MKKYFGPTIVIGMIILGGVIFFGTSKQEANQLEEREKAYVEAVEVGTADKDTWPETPRELIVEFWEAASRKDFERLAILCPGSIEDDYKMYEQWTPSPVQSIGKPESHPMKPNVTLYPVKVSFPEYPNKTIKMALTKLDDGRFVIDGQNTIWW